MIHENRGLNPYIEDVTRRLAVENFVAFAPDALAPVGGYPGDEDKGREMFAKLDAKKRTEDLVRRLRGASRRAPSASGKIGAVGFCFGGGIVNHVGGAASRISRRRCRSTAGSPAPRTWPRSRRRLMIHYARPGRAHQQRLARLRGGAQGERREIPDVHVSESTNHGFHNDTTPRYDEAAAKLAWSRTLAFFNENLRN